MCMYVCRCFSHVYISRAVYVCVCRSAGGSVCGGGGDDGLIFLILQTAEEQYYQMVRDSLLRRGHHQIPAVT